MILMSTLLRLPIHMMKAGLSYSFGLRLKRGILCQKLKWWIENSILAVIILAGNTLILACTTYVSIAPCKDVNVVDGIEAAMSCLLWLLAALLGTSLHDAHVHALRLTKELVFVGMLLLHGGPADWEPVLINLKVAHPWLSLGF